MFHLFALTIAFSLVIINSAHAYIDPATGALIVQLLVAAFATAIATIKLWWAKFIGFFKKDKGATKDSE